MAECMVTIWPAPLTEAEYGCQRPAQGYGGGSGGKFTNKAYKIRDQCGNIRIITPSMRLPCGAIDPKWRVNLPTPPPQERTEIPRGELIAMTGWDGAREAWRFPGGEILDGNPYKGTGAFAIVGHAMGPSSQFLNS